MSKVVDVFAVGVYNERNGKNEVKIVDAETDIRAVQKAVDGYFDVDDTTVEFLKIHYWESKQIVVSDPIFLRSKWVE